MRRAVNIFIFVIGLFVFNWPFLKIFDFSLPAFLFSAWIIFIIVNFLYSFHETGDVTED